MTNRFKTGWIEFVLGAVVFAMACMVGLGQNYSTDTTGPSGQGDMRFKDSSGNVQLRVGTTKALDYTPIGHNSPADATFGHVTVNSNLLVTGTSTTADDVGTVNATYATVVEYGDRACHQTVLTMSAIPWKTLADGDHGGGVKLYDFPEGVIAIHGVVLNCTVINTTNFNASDNDHYYVAVGTVVAADDNDLTGTEANLIAKIDEDTAGGATTMHAETTYLSTPLLVDGSSTACDIALNFAVEASDNSGSNTFAIAVGDTIGVTWSKLGDY
jgi:hypothetical protein